VGPVEFALVASVLLGFAVLYRAVTLRLALSMRDAMVPVVREIVDDPDVPPMLKLRAVAAFNLAMNPGFVPWLLSRGFRSDQGSKAGKLATEHQRMLNARLIDHFFRVNVILAPHWYAVVAVLFFVLVLVMSPIALIRAGRQLLLRKVERLEKSITNPRFPDNCQSL
jgi:hypothetical protein